MRSKLSLGRLYLKVTKLDSNLPSERLRTISETAAARSIPHDRIYLCKIVWLPEYLPGVAQTSTCSLVWHCHLAANPYKIWCRIVREMRMPSVPRGDRGGYGLMHHNQARPSSDYPYVWIGQTVHVSILNREWRWVWYYNHHPWDTWNFCIHQSSFCYLESWTLSQPNRILQSQSNRTNKA